MSQVSTEDISRAGGCLQSRDWERLSLLVSGGPPRGAGKQGLWRTGPSGAAERVELEADTGCRLWGLQVWNSFPHSRPPCVPGCVHVLGIPKRNNSQSYPPRAHSLVVGDKS